MIHQLAHHPNYSKTNQIYIVLLTNLGQYYQVPHILKAVKPNEPTCKATLTIQSELLNNLQENQLDTNENNYN